MTWDKILRSLDDQENRSAVLCSVDFSKSFSRCSYQEILSAYAALHASQWTIGMHAAFLSGRKMSVKIGSCLSEPLSVTGGAVQGSILGVMDHNAVLEDIDNRLPDKTMQKYVDDATITECIKKAQCEPADPASETVTVRAREIEDSFAEIERQCDRKGLKVNESKTKILPIDNATTKTQAWIQTPDGQTIESDEELKLLGFVFSKKPNCNAQIKNLLHRASARFYVLKYYSSFMPGSELITLYDSLVRSVLEYSSVIYGPMITRYQVNELERFQKRCLKCIFGYDKKYSEILEISGLPTLENRREVAMLKFADKTSQNDNYSHLFPRFDHQRQLRHQKTFVEEFARTERLYKSPLFKYRRMLNETPDRQFASEKLLDLDHLFNDPFD